MIGPILGKVLFKLHGIDRTAVLEPNGDWTITPEGEDEDHRRILAVIENMLSNRADLRDSGPADGQRGAKELHRAADLLGGVVVMNRVAEVPGRVY